MNRSRLILPSLCIAGFAVSTTGAPSSTADSGVFKATVQPFFAKNCYTCHNAEFNTGGLNLEAYTSAESVVKDREKFDSVLKKLQSNEMPPRQMPRPAAADLKTVETWLQREFDREDASMKPVPGRVTAHRLNRAEYNNTVRDLLGVDFHPADDFPQDDSGYGFDDIADALSLSPVLMEKYLSAAEKVTRTAIFGTRDVKPTVVRHQPPYREGSDGGSNARFLSVLKYTITDYDETGLTLPSALHTMHTFPAEGDYEFRIDPEGTYPRPSEPFHVAVWIDGKQAAQVKFEATTNGTGLEGLDQTVIVHCPAGEHWVAVSALKLFEGLPAKYGGKNPTSKPEPPATAGRGAFVLPPDATPEQKAQFEARQRTRIDAIPKPGPEATAEQKAAYEERVKAVVSGAGRGGGGRANRPPSITDISFRVNFVEISGPFKPVTSPSPESLKKIFVCGEKTQVCERRIFAELARRAFRRPVTQPEIARLLTLADSDQARGATFEQAIAVPIEAILVSPNFLFRIEADPKPGPNGDPEHPIGQYELASRLSYFLWSSMPDDELLHCAETGTLRTPAVLHAQVRRMLKDAKAKALVENFGGQWLEFRALESAKPDPVKFMAFNDYLRISMRQETSLFFQNLLGADGSIVDFLNGKYSFLNEELAQYYGIPGVKGAEFRKVDLAGTLRGGILTQASVLTASSYATRTSVVLRGKWVLENLLNAPVPPPPPNVPPLDETATGASMSLRQQMEKHRSNAVCAACHARMDPLGFGLENFDAIGRWRTEDGKFPIDASGTLPDGRTFSGPAELEKVLVASRDDFAAALSEKMLIYALGRGLDASDKLTVKAIARRVAQSDYRISSLIEGIVESVAFQKRKGDRTADAGHA